MKSPGGLAASPVSGSGSLAQGDDEGAAVGRIVAPLHQALGHEAIGEAGDIAAGHHQAA